MRCDLGVHAILPLPLRRLLHSPNRTDARRDRSSCAATWCAALQPRCNRRLRLTTDRRCHRYPTRRGIPRGAVSHAAQYPTRRGIPRGTVSHAARYPTRHSIPRGTVSHAARYHTRRGITRGTRGCFVGSRWDLERGRAERTCTIGSEKVAMIASSSTKPSTDATSAECVCRKKRRRTGRDSCAHPRTVRRGYTTQRARTCTACGARLLRRDVLGKRPFQVKQQIVNSRRRVHEDHAVQAAHACALERARTDGLLRAVGATTQGCSSG